MKLNERLVHLRKEKGLTQLELAEAMSVSRQAVSKGVRWCCSCYRKPEKPERTPGGSC